MFRFFGGGGGGGVVCLLLILPFLFVTRRSSTFKKKMLSWEFPGSPVVEALNFHYRELRFNLWLGN